MSTDKTNIVKSGFYAILQLVVTTICYAIVYVIVIKLLGKEQLGIWALISAIPNALIFFGSGVSGSMLRYLPIYTVHRQYRRMNSLLMSGLILNLVFSLCLVSCFYFFRFELLRFLFGINVIPPLYFSVFIIALFTFVVNFISSVLLFSLDGLQLMKQRNILLSIGSVLFCILAVLLIPWFGLVGLLFAQLIQAIFLMFTSAIRLFRTGFFSLSLLRVNRSSVRLFFTYGKNLQLIAILTLLFEPITKYFLNRFFSLQIVGSYDIVNRVTNQLRMLLISAIQVIIPVVTKKSQDLTADLSNLYSKAVRGALLLSSTFYGLLISFAFTLPYFFKIGQYSDLQLLLLYLSGAYFFNIVSMPAYAILMGLGKLKFILLSHLIATCLNIFLFMVANHSLTNHTIALPMFLSISISSIFIIFAFQRRYMREIKLIFKEDLQIYIANFLFSLACILGSIYLNNKILLLLIAILQGLVVSLLTFKNSYMVNLIRLLFTKKPILD